MKYHRDDRDEFVAYLVDRFPKCFFADPAQRRPLSKAIIDDLEKENVLDREKLSQTIDWYMSAFGYRYSIKAGNERVDLNGKRAGVVTTAEQYEAEAWVTARKRELRERKAIISKPVVTAANHNGAAVVTKSNPLLPPALADMQAAITVVGNVMSDKQFEALRPVLATAALREVIARAERLIAEVNSA